jgi:hypothetical protein
MDIRQDPSTQPATTFRLYHYDPTKAGAIILLLLFLATTALHFWQLFRARSWFMLPLAIGGICKNSKSKRPITSTHIEQRLTTILCLCYSGVHWLRRAL